jgi:hypothetical protein
VGHKPTGHVRPHMRRDMRREACPAAGPWRVHITLYAQHQTHTMESYSRATAGVDILHSMASTGAFFIPSNSRDCSVRMTSSLISA